MYPFFTFAVYTRNQTLILFFPRNWTFLFPFIIFFLSANAGICQETKRLISFENYKIPIQVSKTFTNTVIIHNPHSSDLNLYLKTNFKHVEYIGLPDSVHIKAGQTKLFHLKFFANKESIQQSNQAFVVQAYQAHDLLEENTFETVLKDEGELFIQTIDREIYWKENNHPLPFQISIYNAGIIPIAYKLRAKGLPAGIELYEHAGIDTIHAMGQQVFDVLLSSHKPIKEYLDHWFEIELLNPNGEVLTSKNFRLLTISHRRNLYANGYSNLNQQTAHQSRLYFLSNDSRNSTLLSTSGILTFHNHWKGNYEINYNNTFNDQEGLLYNSYVNIANQYWDFRVGSLYEDLNFNVNGKGIKGSYIKNKKRISAYVLDSDMVLFGENAHLSPKGYTTAIEYLDGEGVKVKTRLIGLFNQNQKSDLNSTMVYWKQGLLESGKHQLSTEVSASQEATAYDMENRSHLGYLLSGKYQYFTDKWQINSQTIWSSPYYVGLNRGLTAMDHAVDRTLSERLLFRGRINSSNTRIEQSGRVLGDYVDLIKNFSQDTYQVGVQWGLNPQWTFGIDPYYYQQSMRSRSSVNADEFWGSEAWRLKFNIHHKNRFLFANILIDQGYAEVERYQYPRKSFYSTKITTSIRRNNFSLNAYYQYNPYYITDALVPQLKENYSLFSVEPRYNFSAFQGKLEAYASFLYFYYGNTESQNYVLNGQAKWALGKQWELSTDVYLGINQLQRILQYNPQQGVNTDPKVINVRDPDLLASRQIRIGISKYYGSRADKTTAKIKLIYYHDINNNGRHEPIEMFVPDIQVSIKDLSAISNQKGVVEFTGLKEQNYIPLIKHHWGWVVSKKFTQTAIYLLKDITLEVPLIKLERLKGAIRIKSEKYKTTVVNLAGIRVYLEDNKGELYETSTNILGEFNIFLPADEYKIQLLPASIPIQIMNNNQRIQIHANKENLVYFEGLNAARQVDLQKF